MEILIQGKLLRHIWSMFSWKLCGNKKIIEHNCTINGMLQFQNYSCYGAVNKKEYRKIEIVFSGF